MIRCCTYIIALEGLSDMRNKFILDTELGRFLIDILINICGLMVVVVVVLVVVVE